MLLHPYKQARARAHRQLYTQNARHTHAHTHTLAACHGDTHAHTQPRPLMRCCRGRWPRRSGTCRSGSDAGPRVPGRPAATVARPLWACWAPGSGRWMQGRPSGTQRTAPCADTPAAPATAQTHTPKHMRQQTCTSRLRPIACVQRQSQGWQGHTPWRWRRRARAAADSTRAACRAR
jgi:hypothetical protein